MLEDKLNVYLRQDETSRHSIEGDKISLPAIFERKVSSYQHLDGTTNLPTSPDSQTDGQTVGL